LLDRYARRVYALARSRLRSDDLAEEITQSVFATIAAKLPAGGYAEKGRFEPWLFRVTMNRVRDEARRLKRHADPTDPGLIDAGAQSEPQDPTCGEELASLRSALEKLPDGDREVIELRHHAQMSFKLIADQLNEPVGTVLARHHRALRKLRDILESTSPHCSAPSERGATP
jgi:RNA polymerase sigma-70 factor (ECF subfamily)